MTSQNLKERLTEILENYVADDAILTKDAVEQIAALFTAEKEELAERIERQKAIIEDETPIDIWREQNGFNDAIRIAVSIIRTPYDAALNK